METISNLPSPQNQGTHQDVVILDNEWLRTAEKNIKKEPKFLNNTSGWEACSIFRAPQTLKKIHHQEFEPQVVSIGPYYHGKKELRMIQEHKWRLLGGVVDRAKEKKVGLGLDDFYKVVKIKEAEIRQSYSDSNSVDRFDSKKLIEMMVLDGCFILELICAAERQVKRQNDPLLMPRWLLYSISRDLLKLENQIPFFVLTTLFNQHWKFIMRGNDRSLTQLIFKFFHRSIQINDKVIPDSCNNLDGKHLLHLFSQRFISPLLSVTETVSDRNLEKQKEKKCTRRFCFPCLTKKREHLQSIRPVEKLLAAGIKFKKSEIVLSFLDIKFRPNGILEIPRSFTGTLTSCFLLNSIAFEQCYVFCKPYFTPYVVFMSCLISASSDAGHLLDRRIFENSGTDEEVVKFFSSLKDDVFVDITGSYLKRVIDDVNEYYDNVWHIRWAEFKYNYFGNPWIFLSALTALILLLLTVLQSFYTVYGYLNPP
ncbi:hypothetical protein JCGZ_09788 [Jatropha curcas]|uniref:Uncharacterized protein n=1 Tax=Jatropha curcas TaxID=180498 RepID=A0A067KJS1_JATCU|nr:UPF0481 protein At3g47200 [Jatropha curcas]KDP36372.1 hypothetical protein JCGZ_09788 [Jatropha curcas]